MHLPSASRLWITACLAAAFALAATPAPCRAQPESAGAWMNYYGPVLGLDSAGLPGHAEWTDEVTATIADPARLTSFGVAGAGRGRQVVLTNHDNGYWTVTVAGSDRKVTLALAYLVRFGVLPDHDMSAEKVPTHIKGKVVEPGVLKQYEFHHPEKGETFDLQFTNGAWVLTLDPGPREEQQRVPF